MPRLTLHLFFSMILYNETVNVDASIAAAWLPWLQEVYAPQMLATKCFTHYQLLKLLNLDDTEGPTYAVQYYASSEEDYQNYLQQHASRLHQQAAARWGDKMLFFHTAMEVIK